MCISLFTLQNKNNSFHFKKVNNILADFQKNDLDFTNEKTLKISNFVIL